MYEQDEEIEYVQGATERYPKCKLSLFLFLFLRTIFLGSSCLYLSKLFFTLIEEWHDMSLISAHQPRTAPFSLVLSRAFLFQNKLEALTR